MDIVGNVDCDRKLHRISDKPGAGHSHGHGDLGHNSRLRNFDGHSASADFDCRHSGNCIRRSRIHATIRRHRNLQQRNHAKPHHNRQLEFLERHGRDRQPSRRISHRSCARNRNHHGDLRKNQRQGNVDRDRRSAHLNLGHAESRHSRRGIHRTVHRHWNLQ